jgi:hypothetical protein
MREPVKTSGPQDYAVHAPPLFEPFVIVQQGDTSWVAPYPNEDACPGDPDGGHGGEATGGPTGAETWCFEGASYVDDPLDNGEQVTISDTCGVSTPWNTLCWNTIDVRANPYDNFWHISSYRADELVDFSKQSNTLCLWCGADEIWIDGYPVECGLWDPDKYPGYGDNWNCIVQLTLDSSFTVEDGCTLYFDTRYDTECKYDYFYCEFWNGESWEQVALFNASSGNPGGECGSATGGNPDYWENTDTGQPNSATWQPRSVSDEPAFSMPIDSLLGSATGADTVKAAPTFRWRFDSDGAWSDKDGRGNTDGACFVDNVWVKGDHAGVGNGQQFYQEDFEDSLVGQPEWTFPKPPDHAQGWHQIHDVDPPYEGGDGGTRTACEIDSSIQWRGKPDNGYPGGADWRNEWFYRLMSPKIPITNTGCVVQWDQMRCFTELVCDACDVKVRFHNTEYGEDGKWCPWINIDGFILVGCPDNWWFDVDEFDWADVTRFYGDESDTVQFGWDMFDYSSATSFCRGKHKKSEFIVDNVSVGFFDGNATQYLLTRNDVLHDTFHDSLPAYNSQFDAYSLDTLNLYSGPPYGSPMIRKDQQLYLDVADKDSIVEDGVRLYGSVDEGASWIWNTMELQLPINPAYPRLGGEYYGTFVPTDFGLSRWEHGSTVWYYVRTEDDLGNLEYLPAEVNPAHPDHEGGVGDYYQFSILPMYPPGYDSTHVTVLLIASYRGRMENYTDCRPGAGYDDAEEDRPFLTTTYGEILTDAGYCYDRYDIYGWATNSQIQPLEYTYYDCIVWYFGPYLEEWLIEKEPQEAIRAYLSGGGKVLLAGDRLAYYMADTAVGGGDNDSLDGEFLDGIMGATYQQDGEMEPPFEKAYLYMQAETGLVVQGTPKTINPTFLDSMAIYRQCPYLRDMDYVLTNASPPPGYTAQAFIALLNPDPDYDPADMGIYVEKPFDPENPQDGGGQCVFLNFDFSDLITNTKTFCNGTGVGPAPAFTPGNYYGQVELMRTILEEIFGLPSQGQGQGGTSGTPKKTVYRWALSQNMPNPAAHGTLIRFEVARTSDVSLKVYNAMGQLVRTLEDKRFEPGRYQVRWDGTNADGRKVSSGVYFYKMQAAKFRATKKMLVLE